MGHYVTTSTNNQADYTRNEMAPDSATIKGSGNTTNISTTDGGAVAAALDYGRDTLAAQTATINALREVSSDSQLAAQAAVRAVQDIGSDALISNNAAIKAVGDTTKDALLAALKQAEISAGLQKDAMLLSQKAAAQSMSATVQASQNAMGTLAQSSAESQRLMGQLSDRAIQANANLIGAVFDAYGRAAQNEQAASAAALDFAANATRSEGSLAVDQVVLWGGRVAVVAVLAWAIREWKT